MKLGSHILFPPFQLDLANAQLWRGEQRVILRPKTFAVLSYLVENAGRLVSKKELLDAVWPDTRVSERGLKDYVQEIRKTLGDDPKAPRFIETVARRGYRFIAPISISSQSVSSSKFHVSSSQSAIRHPQSVINLAGREAELQQLHDWLAQATSGERQIIFVTGEPGIGKTTLVDTFVTQIEADLRAGLASGQPQEDTSTALWPEIWIGRGQCSEHYGAGEAYLPVPEALGRLCRELGDQQFRWLLSRYAPTWLVQMPWLVSETDRDELHRRVLGATPGRMLREMAELLEVLTVEKLLVLCLEDLQWSDYSTLDLLALLARRPEPARLLLIGTYRPAEVERSEHPLRAVKQELQMHGRCQELSLGPLTEEAVAQYLTARFAIAAQRAVSLQGLARLIHQRTEGNPLFMVNVVDYLVAQGVIVECGGQWELRARLEEVGTEVPASLRQMIEEQIERLSTEEQRVLEVASVAGVEFSAATVAAGLGEEVVTSEERCAGLVRRDQFLRACGVEEWPDGTAAGCYSFLHALYQHVVYERLTAGQRLHLHRRIGERKEQGYGHRAGEIAGELAVHFEQGRDYRRVVQYLCQTAETAIRRYAYREVIGHVNKGLELIKMLPDAPERTQQELILQTMRGRSLLLTSGYTAPEVREAYTRARLLCQQTGETSWLAPVLSGLWNFHLTCGEFQTARDLVEELLTLAQRTQTPPILLIAYQALGLTSFFLGEFALARGYLERCGALSDCNPKHSYHAFFSEADTWIAFRAYLAWVLWFLGYPDRALKEIYQALTAARELSHPVAITFSLYFAAMLHQICREEQLTQERAEAFVKISNEQGYPYGILGTVLRGWALAEQGQVEEGVVQMQKSLDDWQATGQELWRPYNLALLAEASGKKGQVEDGLSVLAEALDAAQRTGERWYEAELYRLKGELSLQSRQVGDKAKISQDKSRQVWSPESEAEECFLRAIEIARRQEAKSLELRAVTSLSRLWQSQGKKEEARQMLAEIYGWFTEGFDTKDLQEAKTLLEEP